MVINQSNKTPTAILVKAGMLLYTTCIAQASSVEAFFVHGEDMMTGLLLAGIPCRTRLEMIVDRSSGTSVVVDSVSLMSC